MKILNAFIIAASVYIILLSLNVWISYLFCIQTSIKLLYNVEARKLSIRMICLISKRIYRIRSFPYIIYVLHFLNEKKKKNK